MTEVMSLEAVKEENDFKNNEVVDEKQFLSVPAFGYELLREVLIPELLGKEAPDILYWAGKILARKYPLMDINELVEFFDQAGWGHLSILKESKHELEIELSSDLILERLELHQDCHFKLEAGFLAQQIELQKKIMTEAFEHPNKRNGKIRFTVKWDQKDPV